MILSLTFYKIRPVSCLTFYEKRLILCLTFYKIGLILCLTFYRSLFLNPQNGDFFDKESQV